jgi:hypothetical protein
MASDGNRAGTSDDDDDDDDEGHGSGGQQDQGNVMDAETSLDGSMGTTATAHLMITMDSRAEQSRAGILHPVDPLIWKKAPLPGSGSGSERPCHMPHAKKK